MVAKLRDLKDVRYIIVNGHADRLGSTQYNQKLSEKRAEAVRAYLVSKGVDASKVETLGFGKTLPVKSCPDQKEPQGADRVPRAQPPGRRRGPGHAKIEKARNASRFVSARWVVPVEPAGAVLEHHAVAVRDGAIEAVLPAAEARRFAHYEQVALPDHVLIPGWSTRTRTPRWR